MRIFFTSTVHCFGRFFGRSFELLGHQTIGTSHYWTVALYIKLSDYWAFGLSDYRTDTPRPLWWTLYSFFTYTNDLPEATTSRVRLFAYDGLLFSRIKSTEDATFVHNDLTSLGELERKWQICFHPEKCTVISVSERRQLHHQTSQALHGHTLEEIGCGKYLGLNINKDLTRWKHINKNISKAFKTRGFLRRNIGRCTPATKSTACTTLVRPSLECAVPVWNPHQITTIRGIDQVQRRAARIAATAIGKTVLDVFRSYWTNFSRNLCSTDDGTESCGVL